MEYVKNQRTQSVNCRMIAIFQSLRFVFFNEAEVMIASETVSLH
jgi:hypothetical protein